jgi:hypothetical protein
VEFFSSQVQRGYVKNYNKISMLYCMQPIIQLPGNALVPAGSQKAGQYSAAGPVVQFGVACFSFLISGICAVQWRQIIAPVPA